MRNKILFLLLFATTTGCASAAAASDADVDVDSDVDADTDADTDTDVDTETDESTLMWQVTNPPIDKMWWRKAYAYCDDLVRDGHTDWRLPTIEELHALAGGSECSVSSACSDLECRDETCDSPGDLEGPGLDGCYFSEEFGGWCGDYWSGTSRSDAEGWAWMMNFRDASTQTAHNWDGAYVRCVRDDVL